MDTDVRKDAILPDLGCSNSLWWWTNYLIYTESNGEEEPSQTTSTSLKITYLMNQPLPHSTTPISWTNIHLSKHLSTNICQYKWAFVWLPLSIAFVQFSHHRESLICIMCSTNGEESQISHKGGLWPEDLWGLRRPGSIVGMLPCLPAKLPWGYFGDHPLEVWRYLPFCLSSKYWLCISAGGGALWVLWAYFFPCGVWLNNPPSCHGVIFGSPVETLVGLSACPL